MAPREACAAVMPAWLRNLTEPVDRSPGNLRVEQRNGVVCVCVTNQDTGASVEMELSLADARDFGQALLRMT